MSGKNGNQTPSFPGTESGTRRPTVIGAENGKLKPALIASQERKPTVIGSPSAPSPHQPTVIGGGNARAYVPRGREPTIIPSSTPATAEPTKAVIEVKPSVMPGTVRKGLEVSVVELERDFPGTARKTLVQVARILKDIIVETLTTVSCSKWGVGVQEKYAGLVDQSLALTSASVVQDGMRHNSRLYTLLEEVALSFQDGGSPSLMFWKKRQNPWETLRGHRHELDQLREHLSQALPRLRTTQSSLKELSSRFVELESELDASSVAAHYVAKMLGPGDDRAMHLTDQSMSLTKTIATIQEGRPLREMSITQIDALADRIQESILVTLPAWLERVSLVFHGPSVTDTDCYTLRQGLEEIMQCLK